MNTVKELPRKRMKVSDIKPYEENVKKHPPKQVEVIIKSLDLHGYYNEMIVDEDDVLIMGHGRLMALQEKGVEEITVKVIEGYTEDQKLALRVLDNKSTESPWDNDNLIKALKNSDDLGLFTGFSTNEIAKMRALGESDSLMPAYELTPLLHEKYDYILIFFDDELDFLYAEQFFNLERRKDRFKDAVGICRAITWEQAYRMMKEKLRREIETEIESGAQQE